MNGAYCCKTFRQIEPKVVSAVEFGISEAIRHRRWMSERLIHLGTLEAVMALQAFMEGGRAEHRQFSGTKPAE